MGPKAETLRERIQEGIVQHRWKDYASLAAERFGGKITYLLKRGMVADENMITPDDTFYGYSVAWEFFDADAQQMSKSNLWFFSGPATRSVQTTTEKDGRFTIRNVTGVEAVGADAIVVHSQHEGTVMEMVIGKDGVKKHHVTYTQGKKIVSEWEFSSADRVLTHKNVKGKEVVFQGVDDFVLTEREGEMLIIVDDGDTRKGIKLSHGGIVNAFQLSQPKHEAVEIYTAAFTAAAHDIIRIEEQRVS